MNHTENHSPRYELSSVVAGAIGSLRLKKTVFSKPKDKTIQKAVLKTKLSAFDLPAYRECSEAAADTPWLPPPAEQARCKARQDSLPDLTPQGLFSS